MHFDKSRVLQIDANESQLAILIEYLYLTGTIKEKHMLL